MSIQFAPQELTDLFNLTHRLAWGPSYKGRMEDIRHNAVALYVGFVEWRDEATAAHGRSLRWDTVIKTRLESVVALIYPHKFSGRMRKLRSHLDYMKSYWPIDNQQEG